MEGWRKYTIDEPVLFDDHVLPIEIWYLIIKKAYLDPDILKEAQNIFDPIKLIEKHILTLYQTLPFVCKGFASLNISKEDWPKFKEEIRKFYIPYLNEKFLKTYKDEGELYPKENKAWHLNPVIDKKIAQFISTGTFSHSEPISTKCMPSDCILYQVILSQESKVSKSNEVAKNNTHNLLKILNLLVFYGANPNKDPLLLTQTIKCSYKNIYLIPVIQFLLDNKIDINAEYSSALFEAIDNADYRSQCTPNEKIDIELIIMLLKNGADPNINNPLLKDAINWHFDVTP